MAAMATSEGFEILETLEAFKTEFIAQLKEYLTKSDGTEIADLTKAKHTLVERAIPAIELAENINVLKSIIAFTLIAHDIVVTQRNIPSREAITHYDDRANSYYTEFHGQLYHYNGRLGRVLGRLEKQIAEYNASHPTHTSTATRSKYSAVTEMG